MVSVTTLGKLVGGEAIAETEALRDETQGLRDQAANYAASINPANLVAPVDLEPLDGFMRTLDMRRIEPKVIAYAADSTGSPTSTGAFERSWKELAASVWPDRPFRLKRWSKGDNSYPASPVVWQDAAVITDPGGDIPNTPIAVDSFSGTSQELVNVHQADVPSGGTWTGTTGAFLADGGEAKANPAYSGGGVPVVVLNASPRTGKDFAMTAQWRINSQEGASKSRRLNAARTDDQNYLRVEVAGASTMTATLRKRIGNTDTVIGTFTGAIPNGVASAWYNVSIALSGTTVTATLNGVTLTGTLSSSDIAALGSGFGFQDNSTSFGLRQFQVTGTVTKPPVPGGPSPLGWATVYNAAVAGASLQYQIDRLPAMFPEKPDVVFIHHGHNNSALTLPQWLALYDTFLTALFALHAPCPVVVSSQNPEFEFAGNTAEKVTIHAERMAALRSLARERKWGYVPIYEAYVAQGDGGASLVDSTDGIHPVIGAGTNLQTATLKAWLRARSLRP